MTICWKAVKQYFTVLLFIFQYYPVCNFGKFINVGLGALSGVKGFIIIRVVVIQGWRTPANLWIAISVLVLASITCCLVDFMK